jgi:hypothetical protein
MILNIITLSIMGFVVTLCLNYIQHNDTQPTSIECSYAECRDHLNVIPIVVMLNIVILSKCRGAPGRPFQPNALFAIKARAAPFYSRL